MKSGILATIVAAIMSLFGGHQIVANSGSLPAASAAAVAPIVSVEPASTSSPLAIAASPTSTIDYVVTDQFGTTATATRTVIVQ